MITKVVHKRALHEPRQESEDLSYWRNAPPEARLNAIEFLRKQFYGEYPERLQRVYTIIERQKH